MKEGGNDKNKKTRRMDNKKKENIITRRWNSGGRDRKKEKTGRLRNNRKELYEISENEEIREIEMKRKK